MPMQPTWVVVADRICATIYTVPRGMARLRPHESKGRINKRLRIALIDS